MYSGEELRVVGRAVVRVGCGGREEEELGLVVVSGKGPSLLGLVGQVKVGLERNSNVKCDT